MRINLSADDLAKGEVIGKPGWAPCVIEKYEEKAATTDGSTNAIVTLTILSGPDAKKGAKRYFNEKAMGFAKNFLLSVGGKKNADGSITGEMSKTLEGTKLDVYFNIGTSNKGNKFNDATDFAPIGTQSGYKTTVSNPV